MAEIEFKNEGMTEFIEEKPKAHNVKSLGRVQLLNPETRQIILLPPPSDDPKDPLNWPRLRKIYTAALVVVAMILTNFMAGGPAIAIPSIARSFGGGPNTDLSIWIPKAAYFFNNTALAQGVGNLIWVPLMTKYGRRPVYIAAFLLYFFTILGSGVAQTYGGELALRTIMGLGSGAGECLAPLTIADIFFLHERGFVMASYNAALSGGIAFGTIISGVITINHSWRVIYLVGGILVGTLIIFVVFTFPETAYNRDYNTSADYLVHTSSEVSGDRINPSALKASFAESLKPWSGKTYTDESLFRMFIRPLGLILLPPVFWATIVMSVTIGSLVAVSSNIATAFEDTYGFAAWQSGLTFLAALIGGFVGIFLGGPFSDWVADYFTKRNEGIREPEMRLPAMVLSIITAPLSLILYGFAIQYKWHWIVPTIGLGLLSFAIVQGTNVSFVYCLDAYRPIAGEVTVTQLAFKSCFGFLLSFYTNTWVDNSGYAAAYGTMAAISGGCLLLVIPMYFFGERIRLASLQWRIVSFVQWDDDREVGE